MIEQFIKDLKKSPDTKNIFNPWWHVDWANEQNDQGPQIRRRQLKQYLLERQKTARYLLLGEALGYQGGHFSGIAMTSERILLGKMLPQGILPEHVFTAIKPQRTSKSNIKPDGFSEPTATIVWKFIIKSGVDPGQFVIWNAFPWHPYHPHKGLLSNRTPSDDEFMNGHKILTSMMNLFKFKRVIAVGEKASRQFCHMGVGCAKVRHPANGGATKFRMQMAELVQKGGK